MRGVGWNTDIFLGEHLGSPETLLGEFVALSMEKTPVRSCSDDSVKRIRVFLLLSFDILTQKPNVLHSGRTISLIQSVYGGKRRELDKSSLPCCLEKERGTVLPDG